MTDPAKAWTQRYREPPAGPVISPAIMTPTIATLLTHRSVRAYTPDALPEGALEAAIAAAQSAATSSNLQSWSVVAITDKARKARLAALAGNQHHVEQAPLFLVWIADLSRLDRMAHTHHLGTDALDYTETFLVSTIDATLAAQNATAAFESLGLGTVYIGGLRNHPEQVAAELKLPPRSIALFGLCVGKPDPAHPAAIKPRLPQSAVLHHERYDTTHEAETLSAYDDRASAFQQEQNLPPRAWSRAMSERIATVAALHGRDKLRTILHRMGLARL